MKTTEPAQAAARAHKRGQKELPHVRGQGCWTRVPGCDSSGAAERSYPLPKARGGSLEEQPHVQERWLRRRWRA